MDHILFSKWHRSTWKYDHCGKNRVNGTISESDLIPGVFVSSEELLSPGDKSQVWNQVNSPTTLLTCCIEAA